MSGGSAFYVLIYAVFYFVNKVLLLHQGATFLEEIVGFGKGDGRTAWSRSVPVPAPGSSRASGADGPARGARRPYAPEAPARVACAERCSLTLPRHQNESRGRFPPFPKRDLRSNVCPSSRALPGLGG